jgi:tetratricopeptide (TPR) repeat protein
LGDGTAVFAAASSSPDDTRLAGYERTVYGEVHPSKDLDTRIKELEVSLFGKVRTGSTAERVAGISKALAPANGNLLLPAIAPQLDTSSTNARAESAPPPAPYNDALEVRSDKAKDELKQAMELYTKGDMPQAEAAFKRVLTIDSRNPDAYYNLGVIAESRNDLQSALSNYRAALNINPGDNDLRNAVTSVQSKLDQSITAQRQAREQQATVAKQAQDEEQKSNLKQYTADASVAFKAGNFDKAISDLQLVARQAPQDADVQFALGQAYRGKGDVFDARSSLNRAIAISPNNQMYKNALQELDRQIAQGSQGQIGGGGGLPAAAPDFHRGISTSNAGAGGQGGSVGSTGYGAFGHAPDMGASTGQIVGFSQDDSNSAPTGTLTPFAESDSSSRNSGMQGYAYRGGYGGSGMGYSNSSTSSRLHRAAISGLAGAAMGAAMSGMFAPSYGYGRSSGRGSSIMRGAMLGGAMGIVTGGLFSH